MVPHAGLIYSGQLAAAVFNRLKFPELAIVIGPKHTRLRRRLGGRAQDSWAIPGATLPGDPAVARALVAAIPGLQLDAAAHAREHAIEVELPFLAQLHPDEGGGRGHRRRQLGAVPAVRRTDWRTSSGNCPQGPCSSSPAT